jgi:hypothetical protein
VTIRRMMTAVGIGLVLLLSFLATPATAHDTDLYWRDNQAWVRGHSTIWIYDQVCNPGRPVRAEYFVSTIGGLVGYSLPAPCGGSDYRDHRPQRITKYRICETGVGCSGWKYT